MSQRREEQDMLDKVILGALNRCDVRWTALEKKVLTSCHSLATRTRFDNRLRYLLKKEYIQRVNRGVYHITDKGKQYMEVI
ncbi:MAG: winged helix-turn-helix domain-containing protein [Candidatus Bathyarchaeota archaeon]|nr:winged helix-turn-helix domain-containing protein [Candidatus Bathyarchaeota archaeon]